tara:strand:+ start:267 stop:431 length:165 start_codon:yes stop_codon:yes gene_type:complete
VEKKARGVKRDEKRATELAIVPGFFLVCLWETTPKDFDFFGVLLSTRTFLGTRL